METRILREIDSLEACIKNGIKNGMDFVNLWTLHMRRCDLLAAWAGYQRARKILEQAYTNGRRRRRRIGGGHHELSDIPADNR